MREILTSRFDEGWVGQVLTRIAHSPTLPGDTPVWLRLHHARPLR